MVDANDSGLSFSPVLWISCEKLMNFYPQNLSKNHKRNALSIFALALYLDIEDLSSFSTESLTDHSDDKKADFIYINEADGIACIAQGTTSDEWGKQEAKSNKAADLNTAAAWLLQYPIDKVPDALRSQAKLLREGLEKKTITKLIFAYAHNAFESKNVEKELESVRHVLKDLPITRDVEIEVAELGLRSIEELYLTSQGSIQVTQEIELPAEAHIYQNGSNWEAYILSMNGSVLHGLYEKHKNALFSANLRDFMGVRKAPSNVNNRIRETAANKPEAFFVLNNGVTIVTKKATPCKNIIKIHGVSERVRKGGVASYKGIR